MPSVRAAAPAATVITSLVVTALVTAALVAGVLVSPASAVIDHGLAPLPARDAVARDHTALPSRSGLRATPAAAVAASAGIVVVSAPRSVAAGRVLRIRARVVPATDRRRVQLHQYDRGRWRVVTSARPTATGAVSIGIRPRRLGVRLLRLVQPAAAGQPARVARLGSVQTYRRITYIVRSRGRLVSPLGRFATLAARTYADPRGWRRSHVRFERVARGGQFTLYLSQASQVRSFSSGCSAVYSCRVGRAVVINEDRWLHSSRHFRGTRADYRHMVVNHETGHWLGLGHRTCPRRGAAAPVMQQQSKGMQGCRANPWPLTSEVRQAHRSVLARAG